VGRVSSLKRKRGEREEERATVEEREGERERAHEMEGKSLYLAPLN
jgi:hypothetical protein